MLKWKHVNAFTFFFLSFFAVLFYGAIFFQMWDVFSQLVYLFGLSLLLIGLTVERTMLKHERYTLARNIETIVIMPLAAIATFLLSAYSNFMFSPFSAVMAAAFVGLAYSLIAPKLGKSWSNLHKPVYAAAFVGMSSVTIFPVWAIGLAGLIAGIVYIASHEIYNETGGTLGTIAFTGVFIVRRIVSAILGG